MIFLLNFKSVDYKLSVKFISTNILYLCLHQHCQNIEHDNGFSTHICNTNLTYNVYETSALSMQ